MTSVIPRPFLQERLAFFGRVCFLASISFLVVFNLAEIADARRVWADWILANRSNQFHLGMCLVFLAVWLSCRTGERSAPLLGAIEAGGIWLAGLSCILPAWWADPSGFRVHAMFLEITHILILRAVIVPSTALRTFWLSAALVPPTTLMAWAFHQRHAAGSLDILKATLQAALFSSMAVVVATLASRVIYGLRREVREAQKLGQYTLQEKLGEGGMGIVYRAQHAMLRRPTAVKLLPADRAGESSIRRFEREVQTTSRLTHPNTVSIYDYGRTPEGIFYYAMELLDGLSLAELVVDEGPQPAARVVHILKQVCAALAEAHSVGVVHRDIKPANIMLCERWGASDVVKVVDFGLVKDLGRPFDSLASVESMVVAGTPQYISPEGVRSPDKVGPSADIYSVGAVGYYLVTGRPVFESTTLLEMLSQHLDHRPVRPSDRLGRSVPAKLEALILDCLEKDPASRPPSAQWLAAALESCLDAAAPWTSEQAHAWWTRWRARGGSARPASGGALGLTDAPTTVHSSDHLPIA
jgi:eukaryotic-like serine/threonine-protein kinase